MTKGLLGDIMFLVLQPSTCWIRQAGAQKTRLLVVATADAEDVTLERGRAARTQGVGLSPKTLNPNT